MPSVIQQIPVSAFYSGKDRQAIDNGDFLVWSMPYPHDLTASGRVADRWFWVTDDSTFRIRFRPASKWSPAFKVPAEVGGDAIALTWMSGVADGTYRYLSQKILDARWGAGKAVALSFWFWRGSWEETAIESITIVQNFGVGGSPSVETELANYTVVKPKQWNKYEYVGILPSTDGKTFGEGHHLELRIHFSTGGSTFVNDSCIGGIQLNLGHRALPFVSKGYEAEKRTCEAYYERIKSENGAWLVPILGRGIDPARGVLRYSRKVVVPTSIRASPAAKWRIVRYTSDINVAFITFSDIEEDHCTIELIGSNFDPESDWMYWLASREGDNAIIEVDTGM